MLKGMKNKNKAEKGVMSTGGGEQEGYDFI